MLVGTEWESKDLFSESDSYLVIECGKDFYCSERDNYQLDEANPNFYKSYVWTSEFPGAPTLQISAYDYDDLFGDDLIGTTSLDLEDRYFHPAWQALDGKPIEVRELKHELMMSSQGTITMWLDINKEV